MKRLCRLSALFLALPTIAMASWQVAPPEAVSPRQPFFQAGGPPVGPPAGPAVVPFIAPRPMPTPLATATQFATLGRPVAVYAISVSGSLKENLERIMDRYHWRIVWKAPYDYNFDGRVTGTSLPNVIEKLLKPFPLQAVMYMSNRTMEVRPRAP